MIEQKPGIRVESEPGLDETHRIATEERRSSQAARAGLIVAVALAALFGTAGRLDWWEAWSLLGFFLGWSLGLAAWISRRDPMLVRERTQGGPNVKPWDRTVMGAYTVLLVVMLVVAGLDAGRFRWASPPTAARVMGWLALLAAGLIVAWTMSVNTYLSEQVRIQSERGHQVVTTGPYQVVRHPMYVGVILALLGAPVVLGSWWALVPGGGAAGLFVLRTALEDRTLNAELEGYREYSAQVRYRLLPGVW